MKKIIRKIFLWAFKDEFTDWYKMKADWENVRYMLGNGEPITVSADIHYASDSWAVISLAGKGRDYIKFVDLGNKDLKDIAEFLSKYDRRNIDANPNDYRRFKNELKGMWI